MGSDLDRNSSSNATGLTDSPLPVTAELISRTVVQTLEMTNLDNFVDITTLRSACKDAVVNASNVPSQNVETVIEKVKVKVTLCFHSQVVTASEIREAIARQVGVSIDAVDVKETTQRRLRIYRRLKTSVVAEIDSLSSATRNMVQEAKAICKKVRNGTALQTAFSEKAGISVVLSSVAVAVAVDMVSTIRSNLSINELEDSAFAERVGQAFGGHVTSHYVVDGAAKTSTTTAVTITTGIANSLSRPEEGFGAFSSASLSASSFMAVVVVIMTALGVFS